MSDEDNMALNEGEEQITPDTTPVSEEVEEPAQAEEPTETTEEVETPEEEAESTEEAEFEEESTETGGQINKKGYSNRVRELNNRAKEAEAQVETLTKRLKEITGNSPEAPAYIPQVNPGEELTQEQYQQHVASTAASIVDLKLKQQDAINRINSEANEALRSYPELDPDSDSFDPDLSESITAAVEANVRANPYSAQVKGFVDKLMKPYKRSVSRQVGQAGETLAKQVSQAAVKPTAVRKPDKNLEEKSVEELEQELGIVQS